MPLCRLKMPFMGTFRVTAWMFARVSFAGTAVSEAGTAAKAVCQAPSPADEHKHCHQQCMRHVRGVATEAAVLSELPFGARSGRLSEWVQLHPMLLCCVASWHLSDGRLPSALACKDEQVYWRHPCVK